ncbi:hypothetical protein RHECNPAF_770054 [Rhizobium etli CNPAF512]|nr:hypothetical protein RHECNPAF_770054 [Rhizobium etli CNPAF512]
MIFQATGSKPSRQLSDNRQQVVPTLVLNDFGSMHRRLCRIGCPAAVSCLALCFGSAETDLRISAASASLRERSDRAARRGRRRLWRSPPSACRKQSSSPRPAPPCRRRPDAFPACRARRHRPCRS